MGSDIFTDECKICCEKSGINFIRKVRGEEWTNLMTEEDNLYRDGLEVMVWAMISSEGPIAMVEVTGRMNQDDYIVILQSNVIGKIIF